MDTWFERVEQRECEKGLGSNGRNLLKVKREGWEE